MKNRIVLLSMLFMSMSVSASDYPTQDIVRNVIDCMSELGGITDTNMYTCTCRADYLMSKMSYAEYDTALTWDRNKAMPADKGATIRDSELGKNASLKHEKVLSESEAKCPVVKHLEATKHNND